MTRTAAESLEGLAEMIEVVQIKVARRDSDPTPDNILEAREGCFTLIREHAPAILSALRANGADAGAPVAWLTEVWMQEVGGAGGYWAEEVLPHREDGEGFRNARPLYLHPAVEAQPIAWMLPMTIRDGVPSHVPDFATERGYVELHRQREDWIPLIPLRAQVALATPGSESAT